MSLKTQNLLVVIASYIFYGWWDWRFLVLIETPMHHSHYNQISKLYIYGFNNIENNGYELINMHNIELGDSCYNPDGDHLYGKGLELFSNYLKEKFINKR